MVTGRQLCSQDRQPPTNTGRGFQVLLILGVPSLWTYRTAWRATSDLCAPSTHHKPLAAALWFKSQF